MAKIQDFEISKGNDALIDVIIETDVVGDTLSGCTITWHVLNCAYGVPLPSPELIAKRSDNGGITIPGSPDMFFIINLESADTSSLDLGYYYHEALLIDGGGNRTTVMTGLMAVTLATE